MYDEVSMQKHFFSETANWVIPGCVLAGGNPVRASEGAVGKYLQNLVKKAKVTTYVCLQSEVQPIDGAENFGGVQEGNEAEEMPSYANIAAQVDTVSEPKFVYYGIKDDETASSLDDLRALIANLVKRVQDGEILYIHCKGGSGRTGIVVACLLGSLYPQLSADEALLRTQRYFEMRAKGAGKWVNPKQKSPATEGQKEQVREFFQSVVAEEMVEEGSSQHCSEKGFCLIM
jgi:hypothetical protein